MQNPPSPETDPHQVTQPQGSETEPSWLFQHWARVISSLWPTGLIQPVVCLGAACQISVAFTVLKGHKNKDYVMEAAYGTQTIYRSTLNLAYIIAPRRAETNACL